MPRHAFYLCKLVQNMGVNILGGEKAKHNLGGQMCWFVMCNYLIQWLIKGCSILAWSWPDICFFSLSIVKLIQQHETWMFELVVESSWESRIQQHMITCSIPWWDRCGQLWRSWGHKEWWTYAGWSPRQWLSWCPAPKLPLPDQFSPVQKNWCKAFLWTTLASPQITSDKYFRLSSWWPLGSGNLEL